MGGTPHYHVSKVLSVIESVRPNSVLDLGVGYGKWGLLLREHLEAPAGRVYPEEWRVHIEGVEIWEAQITRLPWIRDLYDELHIGDVSQIIHRLSKYDVILALGILEYLPYEPALSTLKALVTRFHSALCLFLPIGEAWLGHGQVGDNPYTIPKSAWDRGMVVHAVRGVDPSLVLQMDTMYIGGQQGCLFIYTKDQTRCR
jgi:hypothetical protein